MTRYSNFDLAIYVTAQNVMAMPDDESSLDEQFSFFGKHLKVSKLYLETYREDTVPSEKLMAVKSYFEKKRIKTATGITTSSPSAAHAEIRIGNLYCYNDPALLDLLKRTFERMASEFDEIMIDDFFSTNCTCTRCRDAKGERTWTDYRLSRMTEISREYVIEPARKINPEVNIILKYPTWGESFQRLGYNTETQPKLFDQIYAGTETRHTTYSIFRNPRYTSFSLIRWLSSIQNNNGGGWFDPYMCGGSINNYLEQAHLTLLSKPKEITLFCYGSLLDTVLVPALGFELDRMDRFLGKLGEPTGISTYLPVHSSGEDHVYDFLGMCGIPIAPSVHFPTPDEPVLLTGASGCDKDVGERIKNHLIHGGDVFATPGFMCRLQEDDLIDEFTGLRVTSGKITDNHFGSFEVGWSDAVDYNEAGRPITFPIIDWKTNDCEFLAIIAREQMPTPVLAFSYYGKGRFFVLNLPDVWSDTYALPVPLLTLIRKKTSEHLPVYIEGEARIAVFPYSNNAMVLQSFLEHGSNVKIHIRGDVESIRNIESGTSTTALYKIDGESVFELAIPPLAQTAVKWTT